jgi:hypothetical protein
VTRRFVDTFYYVALLSPRDEWHDRVLAFHRGLAGLTTTTEAVLIEVANTFAGGPLRKKAAELIKAEHESVDTIVVPVDGRLFTRGLDLYQSRSDKAWGLTDCISFIVMTDEGIQEALTADHHFEQAGFRTTFRGPPHDD